MLALFALLQLADIYTTHRILKAGGREVNPILAKLFAKFGHLPVLVLLKGAFVGLLYYLMPLAETAVIVLCVFYAVVVAHNVRQMRKK